MLYWVAHSGSFTRLSMNFRSNGLLMKPARWPSSWCDNPPVPMITTRLSLSHDWIACPTACPSA
jgi:hypothetical protein